MQPRINCLFLCPFKARAFPPPQSFVVLLCLGRLCGATAVFTVTVTAPGVEGAFVLY